ncbi:MAG: hypothetical protein EON47_02605 [Acetobacteraceae bacterium]|nr:MAG: hypothetical protein EON47_02605 [Acetobacteraceae bacterium]
MLTATDVSWRATNAGTLALRLLQDTASAGGAGTAEAGTGDSITLSDRARSLLALLAQGASAADAAAAQGLAVFAATDAADTGWMAASASDAAAGLSILTAAPEAVSATAGTVAGTDGTAQARVAVANGGGDARIRAYAIVADRQAGLDTGLRILSGDGNDSIAGVTTGNLAIDAGGGDNQVAAGFGGLGDVALGDGRNSLALAGNLGTVAAGDGGNAIAVAGLGTLATTGSGADTIEGAQWVNAGQGDDRILLGNADLSTILWRRGDGNDAITLAPPGDGLRASASRAVIGDGSGTWEAQMIGIAGSTDLRMAVPQDGEAGAGTPHAALYLQGVAEADVTASLSGTDLTLAMGPTGETLTIHNYSAGRVTFLFDNRDGGGGLSGTRTLAGLD